MKKIVISLSAVALMLFLIQCSKEGGVNLFTLNQDVEFGKTLDSTIMADEAQFPILPESEYVQAYQHLYRIRDAVLASDEINYRNEFDWEVKIIHNDTVLNAFAAPGGYMYVYTGIIHFLGSEAEFAGVMAHEIAHADRRHSTRNLTKVYGFSLMLSMLLGDNPGQLAEIAAGMAQGLTQLAFSRNHELEADEYGVRYLTDTDYHPLGLAGFFEKMSGSPEPPTFLSTHPNHENRIEQINFHWEQQGSKTGEYYETRYLDFQSSLPVKDMKAGLNGYSSGPYGHAHDHGHEN